MIRTLVRLLLRVLFRVRVRGMIPEHLPDRLLIIANHQSLLDGVLLAAFLPVEPVWVVHTTIAAHWYFRPVLSLVPYVVVDTANPIAVKTLVHQLEQGRPVAIFPEGRATVTGSLMKIYDSPAFLAARTGAAILPVSIDGAVHSYFSRMQRPFPRKLFPRITLTVMPLRYIAMPEARTGKLRRRLASEQMRKLLQEIRFGSRPRQTLFEAFLDAIALYGSRSRSLEDVQQQARSYGYLLKASLALGRLVSRIAPERETVGVLMPNAISTAALLLGMFATRRVPAMLNYSSGVQGMQTACDSAEIRTIVTSRTFLEKAKLAEKASQLKGVKLVILEDLRSQFGLADKLWLMAWALRFPRSVMRPAKVQDPAVVLFTSGSESKPKGVVLSHDSILANVAQIKAVIEFTNQDKFLNALPVFHSFGLTGGLLLPLLSGCRLFLYPSPLHYRMIPEIAYDRDCTVLLGTPAFLANYGKVAHPYDFYRVRYVVAGAEKLSDDVRQLWLDKFGIRILEGYGATECSPVLCLNTPLANKAGTVGILLPGIESRTEPVEGIEEGGELHVRGPSLMLGYLLHDKPGVLQPPSSHFGEGWYRTGDVVVIDSEGFVRIAGRLKRFAKVAGEMVSLEVVEKIAAFASPRLRHAAIARAESRRGETIILFTQDSTLRRDHLQAAARELGAPDLALPRRIEYLDKLPVLGSGKPDYVTLRSMAEALV